MTANEFPRIRFRSGCCSIFGLFEPREGVNLWFDDDCWEHGREDVLRLNPVEMSPEEAEYWLLRDMGGFSRWSWEKNGAKITQEEALGLYLNEEGRGSRSRHGRSMVKILLISPKGRKRRKLLFSHFLLREEIEYTIRRSAGGPQTYHRETPKISGEMIIEVSPDLKDIGEAYRAQASSWFPDAKILLKEVPWVLERETQTT